jgi:membrane peptidoglycan carboxypeptidase
MTSVLRGVDGSRDVIVNSHGKEVGMLGQELATPGKDLRLTIDLDLQMAAEKALEGKIGAIVAMDPHTGEILAMASRPTFDPNQFAVRLTQAYWKSINENPNHPMMNKAIQAQLAPGSTFKVIMTLAGLAGERRAGYACRVQRRSDVLRTLLWLRQASWHRWTFIMRCRTPATRSTTRWRTSWALKRSRSMGTAWAWGEDGHRPAG